MQSLTEQLQCSICLEQYKNPEKNPKGLPCLHSFCQPCLEKVPKLLPNNDAINCPTCRNTVPLPPGGISALPTAFHINTLLDLHAALNAPVVQEGEVPLCRNHNKRREFYCQTDDEVICAVCAVRGHRQHNCDTLDEFYEPIKTKVEQNLTQIKEKVDALKEGIELSNVLAIKVKEQACEVKREIISIDDSNELVKIGKGHLLRQVDGLVENKIRTIEEKKDALNIMLAQFESCQEYVEETLNGSPREQLLFVHRQLVLHMKALIMHVDETVFERKESAIFFNKTITTTVNTCSVLEGENEGEGETKGEGEKEEEGEGEKEEEGEEGEKEEEGIGNICQVEFDDCYISGRKRFIGKVNETLTFNIHIKGIDNSGVQLPNKHTITIAPVTNPNAAIPCTITPTETIGSYIVSCIPIIPGPHGVQCIIGDVHIVGSPFIVRVLPVCELASTSEHLQYISKLEVPSGVIVKKDKNLIVAERRNNTVTVFNREGERLIRYNTHHENDNWFTPIGTLSGMALTNEGHLLAVDTSRNCILKFDQNGGSFETIGTPGSGPLQFKLPYSIAVHPDGRIFITDRGNSRVQVLNRDFTYTGSFGSQGKHGCGEFVTLFDIAIDSKGYIYVSDPIGGKIQKFDPDYMYMSCVSIESPFFLCFDSQDILYVMEQRQPVRGIFTLVFHVTHNHFVTIVNCRKKEMKLLGECQWSKGCLDYGCTGRISLDGEGFLYICDPSDGRVYFL